MCSLTPPSSAGAAGIQNRLLGALGGVEGERSLPNTDFSSQDSNSDIDSKIMQLELKRARLEAQITLSKTQTMLAEMELHLVEIELRHELWRRRSEARVRTPATPAKSQTSGRYRRLLVRKQVRPTARVRYRKPKSCAQDKRPEAKDDVVDDEENELLTDSRPVDDQSHNQVEEFDQTEQGDVVTNDQRSLKESEIDPNGGEKPHNSRSNPDHSHLDDARGESPNTVVPENVENRIDQQDAALIDNKIATVDTDAKHASRKEQKSNDSKSKTIKKDKRRTYEEKNASSNPCVDKNQEAENNNDMHETNTEALSARSQKSEKKTSTDEKLAAVKNNSDKKNNSMKTCSITMVRIPICLRRLNYCISQEMNNNDVNTQNSETDGVDAVDTTISQTKDKESTPREKRTLSESKEASTNAIEGTNRGVVDNIAQKIRSTCVKVVHKEQSIKKYSNDKKKSETNNIEGKENLSNVSKERYRSRDSKSKSSNKDKRYESKRYTTSASNFNRDKEGEKHKNDRHKSNADKSHDKSHRSKNTGSHRHKKDENGTNKDNAKNKENQPKPFTLIKICYDQSKSSSVEGTTVMQSSSGSEGAKNIDAIGDKETENNDNYFLGKETDAFDSKSNLLDKATRELQDMGNNLLFKELRDCNVKKERSLSLCSMETLKLYEN